MSYHIEYQWHVFRADPAQTGLDEPRFIVAAEGGCSNVTTMEWSGNRQYERRARDWGATMMGTHRQVMVQAVSIAGSCASGCLKPGGRDCTPEAYIRRIRRLLDNAGTPKALQRRHPWRFGGGFEEARWSPSLRLHPEHEGVALAHTMGLACRDEVRYGQKEVRVDFEEAQRYRVFEFVDRFPYLAAWRLVTVSGLPPS